MVDMAMGQPDLLNADGGLLDCVPDLRNIAAGIDHDRLPGGLAPDDGAVLLEQRHRHDHRAGLCLVLSLGLCFLIHGGTIVLPREGSTEGAWNATPRDMIG